MIAFRPLWSLNVKKTEKWLSEKAIQGYMLKDVNILSRVFYFDECVRKKLTYRICYENKGINEIQSSLKRDGWNTACHKNKWFFINNEKEEKEIKAFPSRERLLKRIRIINSALSLLAVYYGINTIMFLAFLLPMAAGWIFGADNIKYINTLSDKNVHVSGVSYFTLRSIVDGIIMISIVSLMLFCMFMLKKRENELKRDYNTSDADASETPLVKSGGPEKEALNLPEEFKVIKKINKNWIYEPDKLEKWLETMEEKGLNLYNINKLGNTFYFIEGTPKKVRYIVDYEYIAKESSKEIYMQDGWRDIYRTKGSITKYTLWSKEYLENPPEIYTEKEDKVHNAKKILITYSILMAFIIVLFTPLLVKQIKFIMEYGWKVIWVIFFALIPLSVFFKYYLKVLSFFNRVRNSVV